MDVRINYNQYDRGSSSSVRSPHQQYLDSVSAHEVVPHQSSQRQREITSARALQQAVFGGDPAVEAQQHSASHHTDIEEAWKRVPPEERARLVAEYQRRQLRKEGRNNLLHDIIDVYRNLPYIGTVLLIILAGKFGPTAVGIDDDLRKFKQNVPGYVEDIGDMLQRDGEPPKAEAAQPEPENTASDIYLQQSTIDRAQREEAHAQMTAEIQQPAEASISPDKSSLERVASFMTDEAAPAVGNAVAEVVVPDKDDTTWHRFLNLLRKGALGAIVLGAFVEGYFFLTGRMPEDYIAEHQEDPRVKKILAERAARDAEDNE